MDIMLKKLFLFSSLIIFLPIAYAQNLYCSQSSTKDKRGIHEESTIFTLSNVPSSRSLVLRIKPKGAIIGSSKLVVGGTGSTIGHVRAAQMKPYSLASDSEWDGFISIDNNNDFIESTYQHIEIEWSVPWGLLGVAAGTPVVISGYAPNSNYGSRTVDYVELVTDTVSAEIKDLVNVPDLAKGESTTVVIGRHNQSAVLNRITVVPPNGSGQGTAASPIRTNHPGVTMIINNRNPAVNEDITITVNAATDAPSGDYSATLEVHAQCL